jgi:3D (Asp-Asp-Asp) domain-containing protein
MAVRIYGLSLAALLIAGLPHPTPEPHPTASSALEGTTLTSEPIPTTTLVTFADEPEVAMVGDLAESEAWPEVAVGVVLRGDDREPVTEAVAEPATPSPRARSAGAFTITAYCLTGRMRNGEYVHAGAVATDRRVLPEGTRMTIDGLPGQYTSKDTGSGVIGRHVDVWFPSCQQAINWGRQTREVSLIDG